MEGIHDSLRGNKVSVVAGVPYEHPAGAERPAKIVRHGRTGKTCFALGTTQAIGKEWCQLDRPEVVSFDVVLVFRKFRVRPTGDDQCQIVVSWHDRKSAFIANIVFDSAVRRQPTPVGVVRGACRRSSCWSRPRRPGEGPAARARGAFQEALSAGQPAGRAAHLAAHEQTKMEPERAADRAQPLADITMGIVGALKRLEVFFVPADQVCRQRQLLEILSSKWTLLIRV